MLIQENYFSKENNLKYMGSSQFKSFMECEAKTLAEINGDFQRKTSTALLVGSYVDSYFEGTLQDFKLHNPEIFKKDGNLKAEYINADKIIGRVKLDKQFMKYMAGEKQVIMTGEIAGVPCKIKIDSYHKDKLIVDLKTVRDFKTQWQNGTKKNFIDFWRYDIQGAIYQEIVRQNTGLTLPFVIAAVTKEDYSDIGLFEISQNALDSAFEQIIEFAPHFQKLKNGEIKDVVGCGKCDYCKLTKTLEGVVDYNILNDYD